MNILQANARGPHNGIEHWFDLIYDELINRGHKVKQIWLRGMPPTKYDKGWADFGIYHFSQVALYYRRLGIPFCIMPSANDCFVDDGHKLRIAASHRYCKFVSYQSKYHLKKYKEWNIPKPKVHIPHPVRTHIFKRNKEYNPNGRLIAGGRLIPKKGLHRLNGLDNLIIFGDGPLKHKLKATLSSSTKFTGYVNGEEFRDILEDGSVFLMPSITTPDGDSEGISNTIKEALLMELPVITSSVAGNTEFLNVFIFDDWEDKDKLFNAIQEATTYGKNRRGREEILDMFSPEICVDKLEKAIKKYIGV